MFLSFNFYGKLLQTTAIVEKEKKCTILIVDKKQQNKIIDEMSHTLLAEYCA